MFNVEIFYLADQDHILPDLFFFLGFHTCSAIGLPRSVLSRQLAVWTLLSRALCLGSTDTQSTADMGRPPRGTSAHFFGTVSAACAVCLPVLCVCDVCVCAGYVSQHTALVLTSHHLVPTLRHLVLSRTISHQSPQHLVPISHTDLAASCAIGANLARCHVQTFHHLDRSPPSQVF